MVVSTLLITFKSHHQKISETWLNFPVGSESSFGPRHFRSVFLQQQLYLPLSARVAQCWAVELNKRVNGKDHLKDSLTDNKKVAHLILNRRTFCTLALVKGGLCQRLPVCFMANWGNWNHKMVPFRIGVGLIYCDPTISPGLLRSP